ncbi:MAG: hypothetical protein IKD23_05780, partial [Lentisphaeria bacterium]|nr:hypothetical protein [Lentisphaeria bacterium]
MSEVKVSAIVSETGDKLSVTVGDVTYVADSGYTTLSDAVAGSDAGQMNIVMDGVVLTESSQLGFKGGTLIGVNNAAISGLVDTTGYGIMPVNSNRTISGMTFSGNTGRPAVSRVGGSVTVTFDNCLFDNNLSTNNVGVIRSYGKLVSITNSEFSNNRTCAILMSQSGGTVSINNTNFTDNNTGGGNGAIYNDEPGGVLIVSNAVFTGNTTTNAGGGIRNDGILYIGDTEFYKNVGSQGSAIYNESTGKVTITGLLTFGASQTFRNGGTVTVQTGSFLELEKNEIQLAQVVDGTGSWKEGSGSWSADNNGTLITTATKDLYVTNASSEKIIDNAIIISADKSKDIAVVGGTVYYGGVLLDNVDISYDSNTFVLVDTYRDSRLHANYAKDISLIGSGDSGFRNGSYSQGGGIYFGDHSGYNYKVENLHFTNNTADDKGGALYFYDGSIQVIDCVIKGNSAESGSGIYKRMGDMTVSGTDFSENQSTSGVVFLQTGSAAINKISGSTFTGNTASANGGAIMVNGGVTVSDTVFRNNKAVKGGAIFSGTNTVINIDKCLFEGNQSTSYSAVLGHDSAGVVFNVSNSTFRDNKSGAQGGVIRLNAGGTITLANVTVENNTGTNTFYIYGSSSAKAYVYVNGLVTMGAGQSFRYDGAHNEFRVSGSSFFTGLGVAKAVDANGSFGSWFDHRSNGKIAAENGYRIFVLADSNNSDMYVTNADALVMNNHNLVTISASVMENWITSSYATLADAQTANAGNILLFDFAQSGNIAIASDTALIGGGTSSIGGTVTVAAEAKLTLTGNFVLASALTVSGNAVELDALTLTVNSELFTGMTGHFLMIDNVNIAQADDLTIILDGNAQAMDQWFELNEAQYRFAVKNGALMLQAYVKDGVLEDNSSGSVYGGGSETNYGTDITQTIASGVKQGTVFAGSEKGVDGKITTTVTGGEIVKHLYGGGKVSAESTELTVESGTVGKDVYGGLLIKETTNAISLGESNLTVSGGTFNQYVVGGSRVTAADTTTTHTAGTV